MDVLKVSVGNLNRRNLEESQHGGKVGRLTTAELSSEKNYFDARIAGRDLTRHLGVQGSNSKHNISIFDNSSSSKNNAFNPTRSISNSFNR